MEQPITPPPSNQPPRRPSVVGPVILIILGLAFLAQNLNLFDFNVWAVLWRLWPVWLIAVGLDLMLGRKTSWGTWAVLGIVIAIVGGALWVDATFDSFTGASEQVSINQPIQNARRAEMHLDTTVSNLVISDGSGSGTLVEGTVVRLEHERLEKNAYNSGDTLVFNLKAKTQRVFGFNLPGEVNLKSPTWDLRLSDQIPIALRIDAGVGTSRLDLSRIQLSELDLDAGVGDTEIILPPSGRFRVDIDSGVGQVTLRIPKELPVRIHVDQGVGSVRVRGDFQRDGKAYISPNFGQGQTQVEIDIDGGVGDITVEQI
ncbi:MAG: LiaI-LiaF-like domain-containing protein [Bacillota bacterium]